MKDDTTIIPFHQPDFVADPLTEIAREGARRMLFEALKAEADAFVASFADETLPDGRRRVVRHSSATLASNAFRRALKLARSCRSHLSGRRMARQRHPVCAAHSRCGSGRMLGSRWPI